MPVTTYRCVTEHFILIFRAALKARRESVYFSFFREVKMKTGEAVKEHPLRRGNNAIKHPLCDGNGMMRVYQVFPFHYSNIEAMKRDFHRIKKMGFDMLWFNPLFETGSCPIVCMDRETGVLENEVLGSLYAMKAQIDPEENNIDERFLYGNGFTGRGFLFDAVNSPVDIKRLRAAETNRMLASITEMAAKEGLACLSDLVLNHVSSDSPLCQAHPEWFLPIESHYPDVSPFNYAKHAQEIIENYWKPHIKRCVEAGFLGFRIDLALNIPWQVREALYAYAYDLIRQKYNYPAVIFDETLYKNLTHEEMRQRVMTQCVAPTYITSSGYWAKANLHKHGRMPSWLYCETLAKDSAIATERRTGLLRASSELNQFQGTVNGTSSHDVLSLANKILNDMAELRFQAIPLLVEAYENIKRKIREKYPSCEDEGRRDELKEAYHLQFLYSFKEEIKKELMQEGKSQTEFQKRYFGSLAISAFAAKAGWHVLCGDEFADFTEKSVFYNGKTRTDFYPQRKHVVFKNVPPEILNSVLSQMAEKTLLSKGDFLSEFYPGLSFSKLKEQLLQPYIASLCREINVGNRSVCDEFSDLMRKKNIEVHFNENDYIPCVRDEQNRWGGNQDFRDFILDMNLILEKLTPAYAKQTFSCEVITLETGPNVMVFVRKMDAYFETIFVNIHPEISVELTDDMLKEVANIYQGRVPSFKGAYDAVMESKKFLSNGMILPPKRCDEKLFFQYRQSRFFFQEGIVAGQESEDSSRPCSASSSPAGQGMS
ncbi:MAG: hypothetical protein A3I12_04510 [Gammaproteobacteria bacterium RIFCSPLOWO2_02_FULL_38_11]|nr:MAG: hypothetical protein A3I12_04510 [Gammaproteobacteria bacterium RIFCSPLOWO2_02_FULL_38_11]